LKYPGHQAESDDTFPWHIFSLQSGVDLNPTVQTILILTSLNKPTRGTDGTDCWKSDFIGITEYTFNPVVIFKDGIAHRATCVSRLGHNTSVLTEGAG
jgi:hypothetical protein